MRSINASRLRDGIGLLIVFLLLASCGAGGGGSSGPTPGSKLFVSDGGNHSIAPIVNAIPAAN